MNASSELQCIVASYGQKEASRVLTSSNRTFVPGILPSKALAGSAVFTFQNASMQVIKSRCRHHTKFSLTVCRRSTVFQPSSHNVLDADATAPAIRRSGIASTRRERRMYGRRRLLKSQVLIRRLRGRRVLRRCLWMWIRRW